MHIWVDADACPTVIKDILFRAADRWEIALTLVANQMLRTPPSPRIRAIQVPRGFDVADAYIVQRLQPGDLLITGDIPLAALALEKGAEAIHPRGERYTADTIQERLAVRDMLDALRGTGVDTGGPPAMAASDRKAFANTLDTLLARIARGR